MLISNQLPIDLRYDIRPAEKVFFLHIPKTAGMSFWHILKAQYGRQNSYSLTRDIRTVVTSRDLENYRCFRAHMDYGYSLRFPSKPVLLTMLRHPVQHQLSRFGMKRRAGKLDQINARDIFDFLDRVPLNIQTMYLAGMKAGLTIGPEAALEVALTRLDEFAFFGVTERFLDSVELLAYTLDWQTSVAPGVRNSADAGDKPELTPDLEQLILEKCWLDLKLYNAAREIFDGRVRKMRSQRSTT